MCNKGQVHTNSLERVNGRTVPVMSNGLQVVAQSIECYLQLQPGPRPKEEWHSIFEGNSRLLNPDLLQCDPILETI